MRVNDDYKNRNKGHAPVYRKYDRESKAQRGVLEIAHDGTISATYDPIVGNGLPADVWNGSVIWITIPNNMTAAGIDRLIDDCWQELEQLYERKYDITVEDPRGAVEDRAKELAEDPRYAVEIWSAMDWVGPEWDNIVKEFRTAESGDEYVNELWREALSEGIVLDDLTELLEELRESSKL